ncbi:MAG: ketopantoate reductase family protein [Anaerovoracaceae bacterium]
MHYAILGAGGTGGTIGFHLAQAGLDVTLLARGETLRAVRRQGLTIRRLWRRDSVSVPIRAVTTEDYRETPDVLFVCVKSYSLPQVLPFLQRVCGAQTIVLPILNVFGTGRRLQRELPEAVVLDGCIYVSAEREAPGVLRQHGEILRVVYGRRSGERLRESASDDTWKTQIDRRLQAIAGDLSASGITPQLSAHIERDCLEKFSYVSPIGTAGLCLQATAGDFQTDGRARELFKTLIGEISALAAAMGFALHEDMVQRNLAILDTLNPSATTSLQRDLEAGRPSEIDGLIYETVRQGERFHVPTPAYRAAARLCRAKFGG